MIYFIDARKRRTSTCHLFVTRGAYPKNPTHGTQYILNHQQRVREQRTKQNAKRPHNRCKKAALKKERIKNTPFAEDADEPFVPFIENVIIDKDPDMVENEEVEFFPTDPYPFRTGTIIEENGFLSKEREMDGLIFHDS
jgi:hypothetical protein